MFLSVRFQTDYYQECNCHPGWGGLLCDEELNYCEKNHDVCQHGTCKSLPKDDGNFECQCMEGYFGQRYEERMGLPLDWIKFQIAYHSLSVLSLFSFHWIQKIIKRCDRKTATSISRIEVMPTFSMRETSSQKPLLSERNTTTPIAILPTEHSLIHEVTHKNIDNET